MRGHRLFGFVHIEKCGGTTLIEVLRRNFSIRHVDIIPVSREADFVSERDLKVALKIQPWARSFAGHSVRPFCDFGRYRDDLSLYTLLREPVARYYSDYLHDYAKRGFRGSVADWLKYTDRHNFQVRSLAGSPNLEEAKRVLRDELALFGTVERFGPFLQDLADLVRPRSFSLHYHALNQAMLPPHKKSGKALPRPKLCDDDRQRIIEVNSLDIALFEWANAMLDEKYSGASWRDADARRRQNLKAADRTAIFLNRLQRNFWYKPFLGLTPMSFHALPRNAVDSGTYYDARSDCEE